MNRLLVVAAGLALALSAATAAPKKPAAKKPARPPVKGTTQMAGDNGKIGVTYTLGKGNAAINFTLLSAEYSVTRVAMASSCVWPKADEKYLVLRWTAHNPNPQERGLARGTLRFTAVDSENTNRRNLGFALNEGTGQEYFLNLKPAQKVQVFTVIPLPAKATAAKLIVQQGVEEPVLRIYFDKEHGNAIKGLPAPIADPADATGAIALTEVPAQKQTYYPVGRYDLRLDSVATSTDPIGPAKPGRDKQFFIATVTVKNMTRQKVGFARGTFDATLRTPDGDKIKPARVAKASSTDEVYNDIEPGEEFTARFCFAVPVTAQLSKLVISEGIQGRKFVFEGDALK